MPAHPTQRRYEALRAYLVEGLPRAVVAERYGYTLAGLSSAVRDFRSSAGEFFLTAPPGSVHQGAESATSARIAEHGVDGYSLDDIGADRADDNRPRRPIGIARTAGQPKSAEEPYGPGASDGASRPRTLPRPEPIDFTRFPVRSQSKVAGLLLVVPDLIALDLPGMVRAAGYPDCNGDSAINDLLSLLALRLTATRRVSVAAELSADPGAALFAGLTALPTASDLTGYSRRPEHAEPGRLLAALDRSIIATGHSTGEVFNLDLHLVSGWENRPRRRAHPGPGSSPLARPRRVLFAEDAGSRMLVYADCERSGTSRDNRALRFADHWRSVTGRDPKMLIIGNQVASQRQLGELTARGVGFIAQRRRTPRIDAWLRNRAFSDWAPISIIRADGKPRRARVLDDPSVSGGAAHPRRLRQLAVVGLSHDDPTLLITNDQFSPASELVEGFDRRMTIGQRLAESARSFGPSAVASAVPLDVDLDIVIFLIAHTLCAALRRRIPGYGNASPSMLQRRFLQAGGEVITRTNEIVVRFHRRQYSPVLREADLHSVAVPWWGNRRLTYRFA